MKQQRAHIALVVNDYDEAIEFYTQKLHFVIIEDTMLNATKRWVILSPAGSTGYSLVLAKADDEEQKARTGNQTGGRVFLFLYTDDFWRDHSDMLAKKINFIREPVKEPYGIVAVFEDLYGNLWDLIQPVNQLI